MATRRKRVGTYQGVDVYDGDTDLEEVMGKAAFVSANTGWVPELWSTEVLTSYKRELANKLTDNAAMSMSKKIDDDVFKKMLEGEFKPEFNVEINILCLLEGSVCQREDNGPELLLIGYGTDQPYGRICLVADQWHKGNQWRLFYINHDLLSWTGDDCIERTALIRGVCDEELHDIKA